MHKRLLGTLTFIVATLVLAVPVQSATVTLYDGSLGTKPSAQGFFLGCENFPFPCAPEDWTETVENGGVTLDTTPDESEKVGYIGDIRAYDALTRADGYTLRFTVQILDEQHSSVNRAGFSVIVLSNDLKGIELGFWEDEVWAQDYPPAFVRDEGVALDTTTLRTYELTIQGDSYTLRSGSTVLSGPLRDYSAFGEPYNVPDFMFLGDDKTSAAAKIRLTAVDVIVPLLPPTTTPTHTLTPGPGTPSATATVTAQPTRTGTSDALLYLPLISQKP
ncbi:hypothetical protein HC891_17470 [Candidatus Gracilibacteria bacterium]|nr:hypothetical protein [Candidatus Gracilibacteria bacterium]